MTLHSENQLRMRQESLFNRHDEARAGSALPHGGATRALIFGITTGSGASLVSGCSKVMPRLRRCTTVAMSVALAGAARPGAAHAGPLGGAGSIEWRFIVAAGVLVLAALLLLWLGAYCLAIARFLRGARRMRTVRDAALTLGWGILWALPLASYLRAVSGRGLYHAALDQILIYEVLVPRDPPPWGAPQSAFEWAVAWALVLQHLLALFWMALLCGRALLGRNLLQPQYLHSPHQRQHQ